jgi:tetratricopeptide (TPR) repeat protein
VCVRKVLLSHAPELRAFPQPRSFLDAAESAVKRAGYALVSPATQVLLPAQVCRDAAAEADVHVLIAGFRYGPPVRDRPELSYPELEHRAAAELGLPTLTFLLDTTTVGPAELFLDPDHPEHGARQHAFRTELIGSGAITATFATPHELETALLHALSALGPGAGRQVWTVPGRAASFIGRLPEPSPDGATVLTGPSGVGKTTAAVEYAHRHADEIDIAWWVPAADPTLVPARLAQLAHTLGLAEATDPDEIAVARLFEDLNRRARWLLVLDDAGHPPPLVDYLPTGPGKVLVTSRNPDWARFAAPVPVERFTPAESAALLRAHDPALAGAERVADALGHLPLAVDQAGALLADTGLPVEEYLRLVGTAAGAVWPVAFDRLGADDPTALDLLTVLAWFGPDPVPQTLVTGHPDLLPDRLAGVVGDPLARARTIALLRRRGLVTGTAHTLQVHRVPAALLRTRSTGRGWSGVAMALLRASAPAHPWDNPAAWPAWQRLLPHVLSVVTAIDADDADVDALSWLLDQAGGYLLTRGDPRAARPLLRRAHKLDRRRLGEDHPDTLTSANNLAFTLGELGEHESARAVHEDTLARRRRVLGPSHPNTLASAANLADALRRLGEYQQARTLNEDTLARHRHKLGNDHPHSLAAARSLTANLREMGDYRRARELDEDTLDRSRRVLGADHPDTLAAAADLALTLSALGEYQEARELDEDTLERSRRTLGTAHPDTLAVAYSLADDLYALGEEQLAERWRAWADRRRQT